MCCTRLAANAEPKKVAKNSPSGHHHTALLGYIFATEARINNRKKSLLNSNVSPTCPHNIVNFGPLVAEICWRVWGIPANFNRFCILTALLHGILVVGVSQTLQCWTEGAIYIWQGGDHVGHWPTFLVSDKVIIYNLTTHPTRCFTMLWYIDGWKLTVIWNTYCV